MISGFVALLDVLGFSAMVASDHSGDKIKHYFDSLERATQQSQVDYVVFSDSIVLTAKGDGPESFLAVASACSRLFGDLLNEAIPLRGAIAFGSLFRSRMAESMFVAGRAVVDAYQFEQAQDWVGVMVAPSALQQVPDLSALCQFSGDHNLDSFRDHLRWTAYIQPAFIPFRTAMPLESEQYEGFAVVPTSGVLEPVALRDSINGAMERLAWLRAIAPSPAAQRKYSETTRWLLNIYNQWRTVVFDQEQVQKQTEKLAALADRLQSREG